MSSTTTSAAYARMHDARAWSSAMVDALFAEHPSDAVARIVDLASDRHSSRAGGTRPRSDSSSAMSRRSPRTETTEYGASLGHVMCLAARDLGDPTLVPPLRALLDTMLSQHAPRQRENALGEAYAALDAVQATGGA